MSATAFPPPTHAPGDGAGLVVPFVALDRDDPELLEELLGEVRSRRPSRRVHARAPASRRFEEDFADYCEADHAIGVASGTDALALALRALRRRARRRGDRPHQHVHRDRRGGQRGRRDAALRRRRPRQRPAHRRDRRARARRRTSLRDPGPPLRRDRRHGPDSRARARAPARGRRGRLPGARRPLSRPPRGHDRRRRLLQLLPGQEPRRVGRRRRGGHRRRRARRARASAALARRAPALPPPRSSATPPASTACRPPCCASSCAAWTAGTPSAGARRQTCARALQGTCVTPPAPPAAGGDHVHHLFVVPRDDRDALRAHLTAAGIASAVHYPVALHRTEAYVHAGLEAGSLPVAERLAEHCARCRSSPACRIGRSTPSRPRWRRRRAERCARREDAWRHGPASRTALPRPRIGGHGEPRPALPRGSAGGHGVATTPRAGIAHGIAVGCHASAVQWQPGQGVRRVNTTTKRYSTGNVVRGPAGARVQRYLAPR